MRVFRATLLTVPGLLAAPPALFACPVCDTPTGASVRAALFDGAFLETLAQVLLPFPVLAGIVAAIYFGGRRGGR